jgi:hypothetical protein
MRDDLASMWHETTDTHRRLHRSYVLLRSGQGLGISSNCVSARSERERSRALAPSTDCAVLGIEESQSLRASGQASSRNRSEGVARPRQRWSEPQSQPLDHPRTPSRTRRCATASLSPSARPAYRNCSRLTSLLRGPMMLADWTTSSERRATCLQRRSRRRSAPAARSVARSSSSTRTST